MHRDDLRRLILVTLASAGAGWLAGEVSLALWLGAVGYILWQQRAMERLLRRLQWREKGRAPVHGGVLGDLLYQFELERSRYRKRKRRLARMLKLFQKATRALPDATVVLDRNGAITWANPEAEVLLGLRWPHDAGLRLATLIRHPAMQKMLRGEGEPEAGVEMPSPVSRERILDLRLVPYGKGRHLLVARDITRIVDASRMRSEFVANASHELRTPLTVLSGYLETLTEQELPPPERLAALLEQMREQTSRMQHMVEELLLLSRLEECEAGPRRERVPVPEMLGEIQRQARALGGEAAHLFCLEVEQGLELWGSAKELHAAFANLVFNAVQYTPPGGKIHLCWYGDEAGAHFVVRDTGIGIPAHHIPRLTERFYRVDDSRARGAGRGGTGLGLAIVKHVLQRHQASLAIESEEGRGSTFRCDFPPSLVVHRPEGEGTELARAE